MAGVITATLLPLVCVGLVTAFIVARFGRSDLYAPATGWARSGGEGSHVTRLLFAEIGPETFAVDAVLESGAPLTLRLRRPRTWWFAECVGELLCGWAETDEIVEVRLDVVGDLRRATGRTGRAPSLSISTTSRTSRRRLTLFSAGVTGRRRRATAFRGRARTSRRRCPDHRGASPVAGCC